MWFALGLAIGIIIGVVITWIFICIWTDMN